MDHITTDEARRDLRIALAFGLWLIIGGMIVAWPQAEPTPPQLPSETVSIDLEQLFAPPEVPPPLPYCHPTQWVLDQCQPTPTPKVPAVWR